jgi:hypothetical protein
MTNPISRRGILILLLPAVLRRAGWAAREPAISRDRVLERRYRAQAYISFCGVTIFSRNDVGGGYARVEETAQSGLTTVELQFAAGSSPAKAHGVNRLGFIQETVVEKPSGEPVDAQYFGFMTSSTEKNFEQARKSFVETDAKPVPYTATLGAAKSGQFGSTLFRMYFSPSLTFLDRAQLVQQVRANIQGGAGTPQEPVAYSGGEPPNTFLNSMRQAILNPEERTESALVYNGKRYQLQTEKQPESNGSVRLSGTLREQASGQRSTFRLWFEKGESYIPTRIEYKAKSFLKLVFEAV